MFNITTLENNGKTADIIAMDNNADVNFSDVESLIDDITIGDNYALVAEIVVDISLSKMKMFTEKEVPVSITKTILCTEVSSFKKGSICVISQFGRDRGAMVYMNKNEYSYPAYARIVQELYYNSEVKEVPSTPCYSINFKLIPVTEILMTYNQ